MRKGEFVADI